ncbi:GSCOCG00002003001-RA-CDS [Cotesia congregata]|nr:GSCOCG00002003001-RA-CDS [Cotesia congregata]
MVTSISISVEAPCENQIQEITYDGQEIYQTPLTLSENLAKTAQKIDFNKTNTSTSDTDDINDDQAGEDGENYNKQDSKDSSQSSLLPFDSIRTKLKNAYTEICVLHDVLAVVKEKRYMVLDPVASLNPTREEKTMAHVYASKKALEGATSVLFSAVERLKNSRNDVAANRSTSEFHVELLRLRQNWRLKKVSNSIIGDLSYRTAGSKYAQAGIFEVTKADDDENATSLPKSSSPSASQSGTLLSPPKTSSLRVSIPSELQGVAYIKVLCQKDQEDLCNFNLNLSPSNTAKPDSDMDWQQKLEAAQNVLFCKELFNQLAREAIQSHASIPHLVVGNQITASIFPNIHLVIALCHGHSATDNKKSASTSTSTSAPSTSTNTAEHDHVLEHSLHQLLREVHYKNSHHSFPHPSSGQFWPSKRRCIAGPTAADRYELVEMTKSQTILEQIIKQTQHYIMRRRAAFVLDSIAKDVKDPIIVSHWNALSTPTLACVKINIWTEGYDTVCRTSLAIYVYEKTFKCVCRDGRVMHMSYEPQELRNLLLCQITQHQILAAQNLAKCMGWQFLANSSHLGLGPVEPLGNAKSCLLASPNGDRMIAVRCNAQNGVQVSTSHSPRTDFYPGQVVRERKWEHQCGPFKEVQWDKMEGKSFLNKMELLMASLTCSQ